MIPLSCYLFQKRLRIAVMTVIIFVSTALKFYAIDIVVWIFWMQKVHFFIGGMKTLNGFMINNEGNAVRYADKSRTNASF